MSNINNNPMIFDQGQPNAIFFAQTRNTLIDTELDTGEVEGTELEIIDSADYNGRGIVKGNDIVPIDNIRYNVENSGLREGSYIDGDILKTSIRELPVTEAEANAEKFVKRSTIPGTTIAPIAGADVTVNKETGIVTVTVIEDFSTINITGNSTTSTDFTQSEPSKSV